MTNDISQYTFLIDVHASTPGEASRMADELRTMLLNVDEDISVRRLRRDQQTQDFGSTLVLVLGTPTVVAVATALGNWLQSRDSASLNIEEPDHKLHLQNISRKDAVRLGEMMLKQWQEEEQP